MDSPKILGHFIETDLETDIKNIEEAKVLYPLQSEIDMIADEATADFVKAMLRQAKLFWVIPSSFYEGSHPSDEYTVGGNVLHTKRVVFMVTVLADAYMLSDDERDLVLAAALLHDITKAMASDGLPVYDRMHAYSVDQMARNVRKIEEIHSSEGIASAIYLHADKVSKILRLIHTHMGFESPIPETFPLTVPEFVLYTANISAKNADKCMELKLTEYDSD